MSIYELDRMSDYSTGIAQLDHEYVEQSVLDFSVFFGAQGWDATIEWYPGQDYLITATRYGETVATFYDDLEPFEAFVSKVDEGEWAEATA